MSLACGQPGRRCLGLPESARVTVTVLSQVSRISGPVMVAAKCWYENYPCFCTKIFPVFWFNFLSFFQVLPTSGVESVFKRASLLKSHFGYTSYPRFSCHRYSIVHTIPTPLFHTIPTPIFHTIRTHSYPHFSCHSYPHFSYHS